MAGEQNLPGPRGDDGVDAGGTRVDPAEGSQPPLDGSVPAPELTQIANTSVGLVGILRQVVAITGLNYSARAITFLASIYFARCLGPVELGKIALLTSLQTPFARINTLGLDPIAVRKAAGLGRREGALLFQQLTRLRLEFGVLLSAVWSVGCLVVWWQGYGESALLGAIFLIPIATAGLNMFAAAQHYGRLPALNVRDVIGAVVYAALILLFVRQDDGAVKGALLLAIVTVVGTGYSFWFGRQILGDLLPAGGERSLISWRDGIWPLTISLSAYGYTLLEIPIVSAFHGVAQAGIYRAATSLPMAASMGVAVVGQVLYPRYVALAGDPAGLWRLCTRLGWIMLAATVVAGLICFPLGHPLIALLYGDKFASGGNVFAFSMLAKVCVLWVNVWSLPYLALGGEKKIAITALTISLLVVLANVVAARLGFNFWVVAFLGFTAEMSIGTYCLLQLRDATRRVRPVV